MRVDLAAALQAAHPGVQNQLWGDCRSAVEILDQHLDATEPIRKVISVALANKGPVVGVMAITDRRLLVVAPRPQAIAMRLSEITKCQFSMGYIWLEAPGSKYTLGSDGIDRAAAADFEKAVDHACAVAVLAGL